MEKECIDIFYGIPKVYYFNASLLDVVMAQCIIVKPYSDLIPRAVDSRRTCTKYVKRKCSGNSGRSDDDKHNTAWHSPLLFLVFLPHYHEKYEYCAS